MQRKSTILAGIAIAAAVAAGGSAFTASNTVSNGLNTGQGEATVAGFTTTAGNYTYAGPDSDMVSGVTLTVNPVGGGADAAVVKARLAASDRYSDCTRPDAQTQPRLWSCSFVPNKPVSEVTTLDVYASSDLSAGGEV